MYNLDYGTMIRVLHQLGFSGEFYADVSSHAVLKEGGRVILLVQDGDVSSCFILNRKGQKLYHGAKAQNLLSKFGILDWKLATSPSNTTVNSNAPPNPTPRANPTESTGTTILKHVKVPEAQMRTWPMLERSVYFLADGTRSIEQIAKLLSRPSAVVEQIIYKFEASGVIIRL